MQIEYTDPIGGNSIHVLFAVVNSIVQITVEMAGKSEVRKGKKGVSLFKQLPWVEQMEGIRKYLLNPKYPLASYPECITGEKKERFPRDHEKLQGGC